MKFLKAALLFLLIQAMAIPLMAAAANADSPTYRPSRIATLDDTPGFKWSGVYFGVGVGYGVGASNLEVDYFDGQNFQNLLGIDGLSSQGWRGNLKAGIDFRLGNSAFVFGAFGTWTPDGFGDTDFSASVAGNDVVTGTFAPEWSIGARFGLILPNQTLVYAGPTWNQGQLSYNVPGFGCNSPLCSGSKTVDGWGAVAGFEVPLGGAWTFGLEGTWSLYDRTTLVEVENQRITVQHEDFSGMARLNFRPLGLFGN